MPTATLTKTTTTATQDRHYSLPLTGGVTPKNEPHLPLERTGQLEQLPGAESASRTRLTPALGLQFDSRLQLKQVLAMDKDTRSKVMQDLAYEISFNGVAFFQDQDLTAEDLAELALQLGEAAGKPADSTLHIHPTASDQLGENGLPIGKISSEADATGRQISFKDERSTFASAGWHTDISFEARPANYSLLRMHTLPPTGGDTLFSSSYAHYDMLSPHMKTFLSGLTATHHAEMFKTQADRHGFKLRTAPRGSPYNVGDAFRTSHPVIRTNPTTGLQGLYVNQSFTSRINELSWDESDALLQYLFRLQAQAHDAQVRYRWGKNDLAIWDNRNTLHAATFDYNELRQGDRACCCGEAPYYDPKGASRKETLAQNQLA